MRCPRCGHENAPNAAACFACATPLAARPAAPPAAPRPATGLPPNALRPPAPAPGFPRPPGAAPVPPQVPSAAPQPGPGVALRCTKCSAAIPTGFKFCGACGTPVVARPAAPVAPMASRPGVAPPQPVGPRPVTVRARIVVLAPDGKVIGTQTITQEETTLGSAGAVRLTDAHAAPVQGRLYAQDGSLAYVAEPGLPNGTFLLLRETAELHPGSEIRVGRQLLRLDPAPAPPPPATEPTWGSPNPRARWRFVQVMQGGVEGDVFPLRTGENLVGRTAGDLSFVGDGYVSSRHAVATAHDTGVSLRDIGSSNGTYVRIEGERSLRFGDLLLVGDQLLRLDPP